MGLCACADTPPISLILGEDAHSIVLARSLEASVTLEARDLGDPDSTRVLLDPLPRSVTRVLVYRTPLSDLGLQDGTVVIDANGGPLPRPDAVFVLDESAAESSGFRELDALPADLESVRIAATNPCVPFVVEEVTWIPRLGDVVVTVAIAIDEARVLVGVVDGRLFVLDGGGLTQVESPLSGGSLGAGVIDAGGEVWLADKEGAVFRGHPYRGFQAEPTLPLASGETVALVSGPPSSAFELYAVTSSFGVFEFAGGAWSELHARSGTVAERSRLDAAWLAPGQIAAIGSQAETILEFGRDGSLVTQHIGLPLRPTSDALYGIEWVEGLGAVVGSRYSAALLRGASDWELLPLPSSSPVAHLMLDLGDRSFLAGGEAGLFMQWLPGRGQCPPLPISGTGGDVRHAARTGAGFVTVSMPINGSIALARYRRPLIP